MKLLAQRTTVSIREMADAVRASWTDLVGAPPSFDALCLAIAHSALETGWWKEMWDYNLGNAKSDGKEGDWCFFPCGENLQNAEAKRYLANSPDLVFLAPGQNPDAAILDVRFKPEHPMCRFRAFTSLAGGVRDHLAMLQHDFAAAWPALTRGDTEGYVKALKAHGYFTAPLAQYMGSVVWCLDRVRRELTTPAGTTGEAPPPGNPPPAPMLPSSDLLDDIEGPPAAAKPAPVDDPPPKPRDYVLAGVATALLAAGAALTHFLHC
jgi:hypothetical protein